MDYVVETLDSHLSRTVDGLRDEHCLIDRLAHDFAHVHVEGWRQAYVSLLPDRFYDDDARAERPRMWKTALADTQTRSRVRIAAARTGLVVGFGIRGPARDDGRDGLEEIRMARGQSQVPRSRGPAQSRSRAIAGPGQSRVSGDGGAGRPGAAPA